MIYIYIYTVAVTVVFWEQHVTCEECGRKRLPIIHLTIFVFSLAVKKYKKKIYKTVILPVVLRGCETRSLTVREEHILGTFKNKLQRRIHGIMREETAATNCVRSLTIYTPCQILD